MKKLIIASAIAMTMTAGSAMASQGEIQFFGNVTSETCDMVPEIGGAVNNIIQLGTAQTGNQATAVDFALKAKDSTQCNAAAAKNATITWMGNLGTEGIMNQGGSATDAHVKLVAKNATTQNTEITSTQNAAEFDKANLTGDGYQFSAQLKAGSTPGDFQSAVAYAVTYK
ncbi:fimbrial protein [Citrobacter freundii]|nr:fimbrial protein [Citrobacter freundii]